MARISCIMRGFKWSRAAIVIALTLGILGALTQQALGQTKPDPSGADTGKASMAQGPGGAVFSADELKNLEDNPAKPATNGDLVKTLDAVGQSTTAINLVWVLVCGFLVMFMQTGFAMVEGGFCRAKHAAHVMMTNFMIYPLGILGFWLCGFALMFGGLGGVATLGGNPILDGSKFELFQGFSIFGTKGFMLGPGVYDVSVFAMFLFQMVFMDTTATIPTGAMAERWRFSAFMVYGLAISTIIYPIYGHMVWGGGGLANLGANYGLGHGVVDFAGSSVVHAVGGCVALAGALILGPRLGRYSKDKKPIPMPGHNIPMALAGTFILAFGWFGFNAGSTLAASGGSALRISVVAVNTMLASASGALVATLLVKKKFGKFDPSMSANGMLAGLVAITAPCAFVSAWASLVIGLIAGIVVVYSIFFIEGKGIDDPVGAVSVHGVGGLLGTLMVGIFADGSYGASWNGVDGTVKGILYGDAGQLWAQLIGMAVCVVWAFGTGWLFFKVQSKFMKLRPSAEDEMQGLDVPEMGVEAYPDFELTDKAAARV